MGSPQHAGRVMKHTLLSAAILGIVALPAVAQTSLTLDIKDGVVNLDAQSVPVAQILAEWGRIGGTRVVGAEKIAGGPVTLKLVNAPERQALEVLLRNVSGYMAAPRLASAVPGASTYEKILILPTAAPVVNNNPPPARTATNTPFGNPPGRMPRPPGMADQDDAAAQNQEPAEQPDANVSNQPPVFTFPQPQQMPGAVPGNNVFAPVAPNPNVFNPGAFGAPATNPPVTFQPTPNGQPMIYNFVPNTGTQPPANGGFTVIGSPTPGMVQQPAPVPGQPVPQRPPGSN